VGRLAAASGKSQPVFYGRCGILTNNYFSNIGVERELGSKSTLLIMPMKQSRKQHNRKRPSKRLPQAKQDSKQQKKKDKTIHSPWLQFLPGDKDDDQFRNDSRGLILQRNGRRELRETSLYVAERNLRSGRKFR
jgi:hypothetical protein